MKYKKIEEIVGKLNKVNNSLRVSLKNDLIEIREYTFMKKPAKILLILVLHLMFFAMMLNIFENWLYFVLVVIIQILILIKQIVSAYNNRKIIIINVRKPFIRLIDNDQILTLNNLNELVGISAHIIEHRLVSNWGLVYSTDHECKLKFELNNGVTYTMGDMNNKECVYFLQLFKLLLSELQLNF